MLSAITNSGIVYSDKIKVHNDLSKYVAASNGKYSINLTSKLWRLAHFIGALFLAKVEWYSDTRITKQLNGNLEELREGLLKMHGLVIRHQPKNLTKLLYSATTEVNNIYKAAAKLAKVYEKVKGPLYEQHLKLTSDCIGVRTFIKQIQDSQNIFSRKAAISFVCAKVRDLIDKVQEKELFSTQIDKNKQLSIIKYTINPNNSNNFTKQAIPQMRNAIEILKTLNSLKSEVAEIEALLEKLDKV